MEFGTYGRLNCVPGQKKGFDLPMAKMVPLVHLGRMENFVAHREEAWLMDRCGKEPLFVVPTCSIHQIISLCARAIP